VFPGREELSARTTARETASVEMEAKSESQERAEVPHLCSVWSIASEGCTSGCLETGRKRWQASGVETGNLGAGGFSEVPSARRKLKNTFTTQQPFTNLSDEMPLPFALSVDKNDLHGLGASDRGSRYWVEKPVKPFLFPAIRWQIMSQQ